MTAFLQGWWGLVFLMPIGGFAYLVWDTRRRTKSDAASLLARYGKVHAARAFPFKENPYADSFEGRDSKSR